MHIHGAAMNSYAANLYSAANAETAAAAQRAAEVRKRLLKSAQSIDTESSPEEAFLIGEWTDSRYSQVQSGDQYHASAAGKNPDFG